MDIDLNGGDCSGGEQQPQQQPNSGGAGDLSADLLQKFSCMNTTDRDVLIEQLKRLLGDSLNDDSAHFWLDMNNWFVFYTIIYSHYLKFDFCRTRV
jgi:hypothetical protein